MQHPHGCPKAANAEPQCSLPNCTPFSRKCHRLRHMVLKNSGRMVGNSETDSHSREIAICACRLPRGILCAEDSFRRMPLRARSLFFALVVLVASSGSLTWAQAHATTKKPNSP